MICATLGHVDHGKTALLRALTGTDADRLPEEKARSMTIDLGFVYRPTAAGAPIAFVDVPGHERFIRNMLAGVAAIDLALLVVAADDGVMPQTREHVAIAGLLRLSRMLLVVTKVDRVDAGRVEAVAAQARALLREHGLRAQQVFRVSPTRGDGVPALARHLDAQAAALPARPAAGPARFAIDRAFSLQGAGTVVTGTVLDGCIARGDELVVSPRGMPVRVRGLRLHDTVLEQARAGQRCAIRLAGVAVDEVGRGQWLVSPALHRPTRRVDVHLQALPDAGLLPRRGHWQLHLGTDVVAARLLALHPAAGGAAFATLLADREVCVHRGDRFILRDAAKQRVVAGGRVLDPFAPVERASAPQRLQRLRALEAGSAVDVAREVGRAAGHLDVAAFAAAWKLGPEEAAAVVAAAGLAPIGDAVALDAGRLTELSGDVLAALAAHHAGEPHSAGLPVADLRRVAPGLPVACVDAVLAQLAGDGALAVHGGLVRLAGHEPAADAAAEALWLRVQPKLAKAGAEPLRAHELAQRLQVEPDALLAVLRCAAGAGELLRLADDRYAARGAADAVVRTAARVARTDATGLFTAAQFRDALGCGRALAIEWLEWLDRRRITVRVGDARRVTARAQTAPAAPPAAQRRRQNWRRRHRFGAADQR